RHDAWRRGPAHDAVVDEGDALAAQHLGQRVELDVDANLALLLLWLDERSTDVAVLDQPLAVRQTRRAGKTDRRGRGRVGHRHDEIGLDGMLAGERLAHPLARGVHKLTIEQAVRSGEVDELER